MMRVKHEISGRNTDGWLMCGDIGTNIVKENIAVDRGKLLAVWR